MKYIVMRNRALFFAETDSLRVARELIKYLGGNAFIQYTESGIIEYSHEA